MVNRYFAPLATITLLVTVALMAPVKENQPFSNPSKNKASWLESEVEEGKVPLRTRMDLAYQLEIEKTKDPATGEVPTERLMAAYRYKEQLLANNPRAAIAGVDWTERGPNNVAGRTRAILLDPNDGTGNTLWAGSVGGGLWKTTNINSSTPNWAPVNDLFGNLAVTGIAYDPSNTQNLYFCTGEGYGNLDAIRGLGVWKSTNGGSTWTQLASTNNANFYYCQRIAVTSTGVVLVATSTGLRRSIDGGTTFTKVLGTGLSITGATSNFCWDVEIAGNGDVYASLDGSIHKSVNGGANWAAAQTLPIAVARVELACAPNDANYVYALCENGNVVAGILRTVDGGSNWVARTEPDDADGGIPATDFSRGQAWYDLSIAVDPNNRDRLFVGGVDIFHSADGGGTWTQTAHWYGGFGFQYVHADQHIVYYKPGSSTECYFGNDGGVYRSTNANAASPTLLDRNTNYNVTQFYACALHPTAYTDYFLAGAQDNGSQQFNSAGIDATVEVTGGDGAFTHIDQDQPQYQFTSYVYNDFYRSANGGASWTNASTGGGSFISPTDYDNTANMMYMRNSANNYKRWDNPQTGATFTTVAVAGFGGSVTAVTCSPNTANRVFFGIDNGDIFRVDNAHTGTPTATNISTGLPTGYLNCIEVETGNDNHLLVVYTNYGINSVWESVNGGTSWTSVEGNLPDMPIRWALFNPNNPDQALVATELGVWSTDDLNGGATVWGASNTGLANTRVDMLQMRQSDKLVIAATHGRGVFSSDIFTAPNASFTANKVLVYTNKNVQFTDGSYNATSWSWDFGDGTPLSTAQHPLHAYATPGRYTVTLTINGGVSSLTRNSYIHVLPDRGTPYAPAAGGNFEINIDDFDGETLAGTSWQRGNSAVAGKNGTQSPTNAWVTGLVGNYVDNGQANFWCPNYNFTAAGTYTLRFYSRYNCENQYDGFNLEYSLDKGDNWTVLGTSGAGWYNFANGAGGTAFAAGVPFFTGSNGGWIQYSRDVSFLAGNANVAFRFVFKTDGGVVGPGVALDDFEIIGPANTAGLPATLSPLSGKWEGEKAVLDWQTFSETQNRGFYVDRSLNGFSFETVGFVPSQGDSPMGFGYGFTDTPGADVVWYRLRQEDFNGTSTYSNTVLLKTVTAAKKSFSVYPVPFSDQLTLDFGGQTEGDMEVQVTDISGKALFHGIYPGFAGNSLVLKHEVADLPSGVYFVRFRNAGAWVDKKVLKQ